MIKKGEEAKVDEKDKAAFEEVQKIVAEQEQRLKEESDGPAALTAVSCFLSSFALPLQHCAALCFQSEQIGLFRIRGFFNSSSFFSFCTDAIGSNRRRYPAQ